MSRLSVRGLLGEGAFGSVHLVSSQLPPDGRRGVFALKKSKRQPGAAAEREQQLHSQVDSSFVVRCFACWTDVRDCYLLLELLPGGDLYTLLERLPGCGGETSVRFYTACVATALSHLHSMGVLYRDLKPENVVLDARGYAKLCDLGYAISLGADLETRGPNARAHTICGTEDYAPPELLLGCGMSFAGDCWSLGVLVHELMFGAGPFSGHNPGVVFAAIRAYSKDKDAPGRLADAMAAKGATSEAAGLVVRLLQPDERERLSCSQERSHERGGQGAGTLRAHEWYVLHPASCTLHPASCPALGPAPKLPRLPARANLLEPTGECRRRFRPSFDWKALERRDVEPPSVSWPDVAPSPSVPTATQSAAEDTVVEMPAGAAQELAATLARREEEPCSPSKEAIANETGGARQRRKSASSACADCAAPSAAPSAAAACSPTDVPVVVASGDSPSPPCAPQPTPLDELSGANTTIVRIVQRP